MLVAVAEADEAASVAEADEAAGVMPMQVSAVQQPAAAVAVAVVMDASQGEQVGGEGENEIRDIGGEWEDWGNPQTPAYQSPTYRGQNEPYIWERPSPTREGTPATPGGGSIAQGPAGFRTGPPHFGGHIGGGHIGGGVHFGGGGGAGLGLGFGLGLGLAPVVGGLYAPPYVDYDPRLVGGYYPPPLVGGYYGPPYRRYPYYRGRGYW